MGPRPAYYFLNVDQFVEHIIKLMLLAGDELLRNY